MKIKKWTVAFFATSILFSSCIKEEGAYREADIVKFNLSADIMLMPSIINLKDANQVVVTVYDTVGFSNGIIKPEITVSPGATISPASDEEVRLQDYKTTYTVTAENGDQKIYEISIVPDKALKYSFEEWYEVPNTSGKRVYDMFSDPLWCNANPGVVILYRDGVPFPTRRTTDSFRGEYGILLETVMGNKSSVWLMDIPLYAGSAFRGIFDTNMSAPTTSAKFGQIHAKSAGKPMKFTGWYKYKSGDIYQTCTVVTTPKKHNVVEYFPGKKDELDIYAVLFKVPKGNKGKDVYLTAEDVKTSERIIAKAILEDTSEKSEWTQFEIPFTYTEEMDYLEHDYKLAIVFSSSSNGAFYEGAIGSMLHIDEIRIETEPIK